MATYKKSAYNVAGYNTRLFYHTKYYHFNQRALRIFYFYVFIVRETVVSRNLLNKPHP